VLDLKERDYNDDRPELSTAVNTVAPCVTPGGGPKSRLWHHPHEQEREYPGRVDGTELGNPDSSPRPQPSAPGRSESTTPTSFPRRAAAGA